MLRTQIHPKSTKVRTNGIGEGAYSVLDFLADENGDSMVAVYFETPEEMESLARKLMAGAKTLSQMQAEGES